MSRTLSWALVIVSRPFIVDLGDHESNFIIDLVNHETAIIMVLVDHESDFVVTLLTHRVFNSEPVKIDSKTPVLTYLTRIAFLSSLELLYETSRNRTTEFT